MVCLESTRVGHQRDGRVGPIIRIEDEPVEDELLYEFRSSTDPAPLGARMAVSPGALAIVIGLFQDVPEGIG